MDTFLRIDINILSVIVCAGMYIANFRLSEKYMLQNRLFRLLIVAVAVLLLLEGLSWAFEDQTGAFAYTAGNIINTAACLASPVPTVLWMFFSSYQLFHDLRRLKNEVIVFAIPVAVNAALALSSPFTGLLFSISGGSAFQLGPLFIITPIVVLAPVFYTAATYLIHRRMISHELRVPMMLFILAPIAGAVLQVFTIGISILWCSLTLSIYIIHTGVQNRRFYLDHLTGVYNRRQLDNHLIDRIQAARRGKDFACIMLDIDNFKTINDTCGHVAGDDALADAAKLLASCIRVSDFLARFAGDEFVIILDVGDEETVLQTISRIREKTAQFNLAASKPYLLGFSIGWQIYSHGSGFERDEFVSAVDAMMYQDKARKKNAV